MIPEPNPAAVAPPSFATLAGSLGHILVRETRSLERLQEMQAKPEPGCGRVDLGYALDANAEAIALGRHTEALLRALAPHEAAIRALLAGEGGR